MLSAADLDEILTLQLAVAWAGESADEEDRRLGWWRSDLVSKYGGIALFERLAPRTAAWAAYEAAREAARVVDNDKRKGDATREYWRRPEAQPTDTRVEQAFHDRWFGPRSIDRIRDLLNNFDARFAAYPHALAALSVVGPAPPSSSLSRVASVSARNISDVGADAIEQLAAWVAEYVPRFWTAVRETLGIDQ